jgi:hypothetical protein
MDIRQATCRLILNNLTLSLSFAERCGGADLDRFRGFYRECFGIEHIGRDVVEPAVMVGSGYAA